MSTTRVVDAPHRRTTVAEVRAHRDEIQAIGTRYGVSNIRVFGSVARGEVTDTSDLDLLVDIAPKRDLFDLAGFALDVETLLGVFTQANTENGLMPRMRSRVLAECVSL